MTEGQKTIISLVSITGFAAAVLLLLFFAIMTASCAAPKSANEPQSQSVFGISRTCDDCVSEITYSRDVFEVCATNVGTLTVHDVGCGGKNLEVCDNEVSYIVAGGKTKTFSRNCVIPSEMRDAAVQTHLACLKEILK